MGSAPSPNLEVLRRCDVVFFANAAVHLRSVLEEGKHIWVLSTPILQLSQRTPEMEARRADVCGASVDELITVTRMNQASVASSLEALSITASRIVPISPREKQRCTKRAIGPLLSIEALLKGGPFWKAVRYAGLGFIPVARRSRGSLPHALRPSTGVFAVLLALQLFGEATEHHVTGVSVDQADYEFSGGVRPGAQRGHMPADLLALRRAARRRPTLTCSDPDLAKRTGIKLTYA